MMNSERGLPITNVIKKSSAGLQTLPLSSVMLAQRRIFLSDTITKETANTIIQQLLFLEAENSFSDINIYISSSGGEVDAGLVIYDQLKGMETPVNLCCTGMAASMAAIILAGGGKAAVSSCPTARYLRSKGYEVRILNIAHPEKGTISYDSILFLESYADVDALSAAIINAAIKKTNDEY